MKSPTLSNATVATWVKRANLETNTTMALIPFSPALVAVQKTNVKTASVGEYTPAVTTCLHGTWTDWTAEGVERGIRAGVIPPCARSCYAFRQMICYPSYRAGAIRNYHMRRADPIAYYRVFFAAAAESGRLRVNESGDFENVEQVQALYQVASEHPEITVWGYTQKPVEWLEGAPDNVKIRVSCWTDCARAADLERRGYLTACVTECETKVNCPAQKVKGWHCADCAKRGCGCCGACKRVCFRKH